MVQKRLFRPEGEEDSNKRRHSASTSKGLNYGRNIQETVSCLEPLIRKWVQESVELALNRHVSTSSYSLVEPTIPPRSLQLLFGSNIPIKLFTGNRLTAEHGNPIQVFLYDSVSKHVITCGPLSSLKATVAVLDGDFDREDWSTNEFEEKLMKNRAGKRPLLAGEMTVTLKNGVGCIGDVSFTDNSSWVKSGKFRLAVKPSKTASCAVDDGIREAVSNAFKVKDHRGESYKKHYPPCSGDEVWRLEKIAKDGQSHKKLNKAKIYSVGDFLRFYQTDHLRLRSIIRVSDKAWQTITRHAMTCNLNDNQHPVNSLTSYQMTMVGQDPRQNFCPNPTCWIPNSDPSLGGYPMLSENSAADSITNSNLGFPVDFQQDYQGEMGMNIAVPIMSSLSEVEEEDNNSFQLGESSYPTLENINPSFRNSFQFAEPSRGAGFCNFKGSQNNIPQMDDDNCSFTFLSERYSQDVFGCTIPSTNSETRPRPKARWCKVLAAVKWRILVKRNVAARKWKSYRTSALKEQVMESL